MILGPCGHNFVKFKIGFVYAYLN